MAGFLMASALLIAFTLLFMLRPWLRKRAFASASSQEVNAAIYREQLLEVDRDLKASTLSATDQDQVRDELKRRLLADVEIVEPQPPTTRSQRATWISLVFLIPVSAAALYAYLGNPAAVMAPEVSNDPQAKIERMLAKLTVRMERHPEDTRGWVVLARSYRALRRMPEAQAAFERSGDALYKDPSLLAEYADVLAAQAMGDFEGRPTEMIDRALKLDPNHVMALLMAASAAYDRKDLKQAIAHWEQVQRQIQPDSEDGRWLAGVLAQVRAEAGVASPTSNKTRAASVTVSGRVSLSPELAEKALPGDAVFVFARASHGPTMPLAVQRARVSDLPLDFKLDDTMAISPAAKLSDAAEIRVEARISRTGDATPATGDLFGTSPPIKPGAKNVSLQIDDVRQ